MLKILTIATFTLMSCFGPIFAQETKNEKDAVMARLQQATDAINKGDGSLAASLYTSDAVIIHPITGKVIEGSDAIIKYLQEKIGQIKGKKISFTVSTVEFPEDDTAVVKGVLYLNDGGKVIDRQARRLELVKDDGNWYLDSLREIQVALPPSAYEHLKELAWLVGNWVDDDEDSTISFNTTWYANNNFIIQDFMMEIYGLETLQGKQIIGWNPIEKQFTTCLYDSDGSIGSGIWSKTDNGWNSKLNFILSDGQKASCTNVYTNINDKSYTYSSIDRKVEDKTLPDIEPTTIVKG